METLFTTGLTMNYGVLIGGSNNTTGWGKTQFSLRLACELSIAIVETLSLPSADARVIVVSTLDVLRSCLPLTLGTVLVFDDFHISDREQIVHLSEHGTKNLLCPRMCATLRGRFGDIVIPAGIPRLFTGNVTSGSEWCGDRLPWSPPLQRRVIAWSISEALVDRSWVPAVGENSDADSVGAQLRSNVALPPVAQPADSNADFLNVSGWRFLLRRALVAILGP